MYLCLPELFDTAVETKYKTINLTLNVCIISCCLYEAENQVTRIVDLCMPFSVTNIKSDVFNNTPKKHMIKDVMIKDKHALR